MRLSGASGSISLDELIRIRELQRGQLRALEAGDLAELERLSDERREANERLLSASRGAAAATEDAKRLAAELLEADRELVAAARQRRSELAKELSGVARGRDALGRYRPERSSSRLLDRSS